MASLKASRVSKFPSSSAPHCSTSFSFQYHSITIWLLVYHWVVAVCSFHLTVYKDVSIPCLSLVVEQSDILSVKTIFSDRSASIFYFNV